MFRSSSSVRAEDSSVFIFVNHTNVQVGPAVSQLCVHQPILFHIQLLNVIASESRR